MAAWDRDWETDMEVVVELEDIENLQEQIMVLIQFLL